MKNFFLILFCLFLLFGTTSSEQYFVFYHQTSNSEFKLPTGIEEGDIAFRRGNSIASHIVLSADNAGYFSHVGIIIKIGDTLMIAHEVPGESLPEESDILRIVSLSNFFSEENAESGAIMHVNCLSSQKNKAIKVVTEKLKQKIPFDHNYSLNDSNKMYCTELVWFAYLQAGIDLTEGKRTKIKLPIFSGDYILPSDIYSHPYLKNQFNLNLQ